MEPSGPPDGSAQSSAESTFHLLDRVRAGDRQAVERLFSRYGPRLRRWASGCLPRWARDAADTQDLVQEVLLQTFKKIGGFETRPEAGLQAYLRTALLNRVRDELRRHARRPVRAELDDGLEAAQPSPFEEVLGRETAERYERALARLRPEDREAIIGRVEMGCTYEELADALGKPSTEAARQTARRALLKLAEEMKRGG